MSSATDPTGSEGAGVPAPELSGPSWTLRGLGGIWAALPSVVMVALTLLPSVAAHGAARTHIWIAAGASLVAVNLMSRRRSLEVVAAVRRPHYMQALTQTGVFVAWGLYWEPVAGFAGLVLVQVAFAYQIDALIAWRRGVPWTLGFGPLPIVLSINLFLWFKDDYFGWQLVMVALCYLAKHVIAWRREGRRRHVFNPSSFGLAVVSAGLLAAGASDVTYGREIALTQEAAPYFIHTLFALGLIVQLQFGVVLVTASAAVSTWLLGVIFFRVSGVYMFGTTDIPAAVFLGMLLLVTDPATSPRGNAAKVLFGAAYGALAFALFPVLEAMGSLGYYDKLLPVPLLNLLVRRFEGWGGALGARLSVTASTATTSAGRNLVHVGVWAGAFVFLIATDAVGRDHPGRDILFWQRACVDQRFNACSTYFNLMTNECEGGRGEACHNLGVELLEREQRGQVAPGRSGLDYLRKACELGTQLSCELLESLSGSPGPPGPTGPPTPAGPPAPATVLADSEAALVEACDGGTAEACHGLADRHGVRPRPATAWPIAMAEASGSRGTRSRPRPTTSAAAIWGWCRAAAASPPW